MPNEKERRVTRRTIGRSVVVALSSFRWRAVCAATSGVARREALSSFNHALSSLSRDLTIVRATRVKDRDTLASSEERQPIRAAPSGTPISERANALIVSSEVGSARLYAEQFQHPTWARGSSGVTIGVGYDLGYETPGNFRSDWEKYLGAEEIVKLSTACGFIGAAAYAQLSQLNAVLVPWSQALAQFTEKTRPRYVGETEHALPNCSSLSSDSLGALVSLVYNRGASFNVSTDTDKSQRYKEMRNIKGHMVTKAFSKIPAELRSMKRLWENEPDMRGLLIRRELEAELFEIGL
jgi:hypothetical protein